mgnify:CR=1 FL=1
MVSIIIPSLGRTEQCKKCIERIYETMQGFLCEVIVITEDEETQKALKGMCTLIEEGGTAVQKWNRGYAESIGSWVLLGADDLWFDMEWYKVFLNSKNKGFVGFNDLANYTGNATHFMMSKDFINSVLDGHFIYPEYKAWYFDLEICHRARKAGRYLYLEDCIVEHRHWNWNKSKKDKTYELGQSRINSDKLLYEKRKQKFDID